MIIKERYKGRAMYKRCVCDMRLIAHNKRHVMFGNPILPPVCGMVKQCLVACAPWPGAFPWFQ